MTGTPQPSLARALVTIHKVITRGLDVTQTRSQSFAEEGLSDATLRSGFVSYARTLVPLTHAHHLAEDDVLFPTFRGKIPDAPWNLLIVQHREIAPLLDQLKVATDEAEASPQAAGPLSRINRIAAALAEMWQLHIAEEERIFSPDRMDATVAPDEQGRILQLVREHAREHGGPPELEVPFILHNLSPEDRAALSAEMPPIISQELVPVVWKDQWAPMKPFLLP